MTQQTQPKLTKDGLPIIDQLPHLGVLPETTVLSPQEWRERLTGLPRLSVRVDVRVGVLGLCGAALQKGISTITVEQREYVDQILPLVRNDADRVMELDAQRDFLMYLCKGNPGDQEGGLRGKLAAYDIDKTVLKAHLTPDFLVALLGKSLVPHVTQEFLDQYHTDVDLNEAAQAMLDEGANFALAISTQESLAGGTEAGAVLHLIRHFALDLLQSVGGSWQAFLQQKYEVSLKPLLSAEILGVGDARLHSSHASSQATTHRLLNKAEGDGDMQTVLLEQIRQQNEVNAQLLAELKELRNGKAGKK